MVKAHERILAPALDKHDPDSMLRDPEMCPCENTERNADDTQRRRPVTGDGGGTVNVSNCVNFDLYRSGTSSFCVLIGLIQLCHHGTWRSGVCH